MSEVLDLSKSLDFFAPSTCASRIHIIGCGAIGSTLGELLARTGLTRFTLYDFDTVEPHNIANQMFTQQDIGRKKTEALCDIMCAINPAIRGDIILHSEGYQDQKLAGIVFLCVDNIDLRRQIVERCRSTGLTKAIFDFRMRLTDAQHYAADMANPSQVTALLNSMAFTHEEAAAETPRSACNLTLSFAPTVRNIVSAGVANFVNFLTGRPLHKLIVQDTFNFSIDAF